MGEKLITEIPLIARYSRHNEGVDWRFRSFLKAGNISNVDLDATVKEITDDIWSRIDCTKCANCCKSLEVVVDDPDIKRLAVRLKISVRQFQQKYVKTSEGRVKYFKSQPCVFLGSDNKCTVYEDRPQACRDFPYLHKEGFRSRTIMMVHNQEVCPIVFNMWQELKRMLWGKREPIKRSRG